MRELTTTTDIELSVSSQVKLLAVTSSEPLMVSAIIPS